MTPDSSSEPTDTQIARWTTGFMEWFIEDKYPQYTNQTFAFEGNVNEYDTTWDCGSDHWWQVIGTISITGLQSHYYHVSLGYIDGEYEVAKVSIAPSSQYPNFIWDEKYRSESQMIKIGWLWPEE